MEALFELFEKIHPVSNGLQDYVIKNLKRRELKRKELLVKKHQTNSIGSFLNKGLLHCYYLENGKKKTSWFLQEYKLAISVQSFFTQTPSNEYIQALEPCEIFYLTWQELQAGYDSYPELNYIMRELIQRYYVIKEKHTYQLQKGATIQERFEWFTNTFPDLVTRVPMRHIATFLGVTEETLCRVRSRKH